MKAVIHIGTHKTGTTTIQNFLKKNQEKLKKQGIIVPEGCWAKNNAQHEELFAIVMNPDVWNSRSVISYLGHFTGSWVFKKRFTVQDQMDLWEHFLRDIESNHCKNDLVLLSCEDLSLLTEQEIEKLKTLLESLFDDIIIVLYLRRQPEYLVSFYNTLVFIGANWNFWDHVNQPKEYSILAYHQIVKRWSIFGKDKLKIRIFDSKEFQNNDLLSDFAHTVGFDISGLDRIEDQNVSLGSTDIEFLRLLNSCYPFFSKPYTSDCSRWPWLPYAIATHSYNTSEGKKQKAYHLNRSEAQHILDLCREGNDWIAREYQGREKLFNEDVSMYPEEVDSPHGLTYERCAEIAASLWKERCGVIHELQEKDQQLQMENQKRIVENQKLMSEKDAEVRRLRDNLALLQIKHSIYWHYYRCKLLAKITFGKKHKYYRAKQDFFHDKLREIRKLATEK